MIRYRVPFAVAVATLLAARVEAAPLSQDRINEYAAVCLATRIAVDGLAQPDALLRAAPGPFRARVAGYHVALQRLLRVVAALEKPQDLNDRSPANAGRWAHVAAAVRELRIRVQPPRTNQGRPAAETREARIWRLRLARAAVLALRGALREARP